MNLTDGLSFSQEMKTGFRLDRDEKLGALEERADALQDGAAQFEKQAAAMKNKFWLENLKMMIISGVVGVIVLGLLYWKFFMDTGPAPPPYYMPPPPPPPAQAPAAGGADAGAGDQLGFPAFVFKLYAASLPEKSRQLAVHIQCHIS